MCTREEASLRVSLLPFQMQLVDLVLRQCSVASDTARAVAIELAAARIKLFPPGSRKPVTRRRTCGNAMPPTIWD